MVSLSPSCFAFCGHHLSPRRGCTHVKHGRSRMTIDPRIRTTPGRSTSGFHRPGRHRLHRELGGGGLTSSGWAHVHTHLLCVRFGLLCISLGCRTTPSSYVLSTINYEKKRKIVPDAILSGNVKTVRVNGSFVSGQSLFFRTGWYVFCSFSFQRTPSERRESRYGMSMLTEVI